MRNAMSGQATRYLQPTQTAGRDFIQRGLKGPVAGNTLTENIFQGNAVDSCP